MGVGKFLAKSGRELADWEVPVGKFVEACSQEPDGLARTARHRHILAVAAALERGEKVPGPVLAAYSGAELEQAALDNRVLRGDREAQRIQDERALAEGRSRFGHLKFALVYVLAAPELYEDVPDGSWLPPLAGRAAEGPERGG